MRAFVFYQHGGPEVLQYREDLPIPQIAPDEVLVRVRYAALNRLDDFVRAGWRGLDLAFPHVLGADFSGEISATGSAVIGWNVGQAVVANPGLWCGICAACMSGRHNLCERFAILGEHVPGAFAEYVKVPARNLVAIPRAFLQSEGESDGMILAAAAPLVSVTAWHMLITNGSLRPGETVLIVGAGGGVNTMATQIALLGGATVYVVTGNAEKAKAALKLGAHAVFDRSIDADWSKAVWNATGRRGVDIVVDNAGVATWNSSLRCLAKGGRLLTVGGTTGYSATTPVNLLFGKHLSIFGSSMGSQADFEAVMAQIWSERLNPIVDRVFPLSEYGAALAHMLAGDGFGKIVLEIGR